MQLKSKNMVRCHQPGHQAMSCPSVMERDVATCNLASEAAPGQRPPRPPAPMGNPASPPAGVEVLPPPHCHTSSRTDI
ncbi:UNVERIFIED_CONTAM: hypothetical protein FKN15_047787 [Acipenser sinensis]